MHDIVEKERGELREALDILEAHLGTGTRPYDSEDGTCQGPGWLDLAARNWARPVAHMARQGPGR